MNSRLLSAKERKTSTEQYYCEFEEDEDDFLNEFLTSRKNKMDTYKVSNKTAQINPLELSDDDEGRENPTKNVLFLKTQRNISPQNNTTESQDNEVSDSSVIIHNDSNDSFSSKHSEKARDEITQAENDFMDSTDIQKPEDNSGETMSSSMRNLTLSQTLESSTTETSDINSTVKLSDVTHMESTERLPPKPKPRQKTFGLIYQTIQNPAEESMAEDVSRAHTSSTSTHLSSDTSSNVSVASCSPHCLEEDHTVSHSLSKSSSSHSEPSQLLNRSTVDSGSRDYFVPDHRNEQESSHSASYEEGNEWQKKNKSKEVMQEKQEEKQKEKPKKEKESKVKDAIASFKAWKKRKADYFKAKNHEKKKMIKKVKEATVEDEKKRFSSEQEFQRWKSERDHSLKEKYRKQLETENQLQMKKQEEEEERKKNSTSAFSSWCEIKKNVTQEQHTLQRKKREEERRMKEEWDQMAPQEYDNWQEWLEKKREKTKEIMKLKQKEEMQKRERETKKKQDAIASYEAWKKSKADYFKAKDNERKEMIRKGKEATLKEFRKRRSATLGFQRWKSQYDDFLNEKYRKQLETENKLKMKKQEEEEGRTKNCKSAFSSWCEKKKIIQQQHTLDQKTLQNMMEVKQLLKEELDQRAREEYEKWLARKHLEEKKIK